MASSWWSGDTVAVVTGANRGIGFQIVGVLSEQGLTVVLTARDETKDQQCWHRLQSESIKEVFRNEDNYSEELADSLAARYLEDVRCGRIDGEDWLPPGTGKIYAESQMFLSMYTIALGKSLAKSQRRGQEIFLAGMCPGVTLTDMVQKAINSGRSVPKSLPMKSVVEGADTAIWLALLPKSEWQGKSGKMFAERAEYAFGMDNPY